VKKGSLFRFSFGGKLYSLFSAVVIFWHKTKYHFW